jgi:hypothetical protein
MASGVISVHFWTAAITLSRLAGSWAKRAASSQAATQRTATSPPSRSMKCPPKNIEPMFACGVTSIIDMIGTMVPSATPWLSSGSSMNAASMVPSPRAASWSA